jgi:hypothetical protein
VRHSDEGFQDITLWPGPVRCVEAFAVNGFGDRELEDLEVMFANDAAKLVETAF